jgi:acyl-CoA thioesterase-1
MRLAVPPTRPGSWLSIGMATALLAGSAVLPSSPRVDARMSVVPRAGGQLFAASPGSAARLGAPSARTVVVLGDSVPAGAACGCTPFAAEYAKMVAEGGADARLINLAQNGFTAHDVRLQVETVAAGSAIRDATTVLVMAGANDFGPAFDEVRRQAAAPDASFSRTAALVDDDITATVDEIRKVGRDDVSVIVFGYWNVMEDGAVGRADYGDDGLAEAVTATEYANRALRRAATEVSALYVPTDVAFKGVDGDQDPTGLLADDGDHPNAQGHELIAEAAYAALPNG